MVLISDDEFFAPAQSPDNAPAPTAQASSRPAPRIVNDKTFLAADPLSREALAPSLMDVLTNDGNALEEVKRGLKKGVGMAGQLSDMVLGLPGQAIRIGANVGGRLNALTSGGSADDADWAGKAMADQVPPSLTNPVGTLMRTLGFGEDYDKNQVAHVMESVMGVASRGGEWVEKETGKILTKRAVEDLFETTLFAVGARGTAAGIDPKLARVREPGKVIPVGPMKGLHIDEARRLVRGYKAPPQAADPYLDGDPIPVGEAHFPPDSGAGQFRPTGPDVWAFPRAQRPVGEAVDLTNEPKIPTGEAAEVPYIPTGEAVELPAEGIPAGEARRIGGVVGEKIADRMTAEREAAAFADAKKLAPETYAELKAKGLLPAVAVAGTGLGLALAYPEEKDTTAAMIAGGALLGGRGRRSGMEYLRHLPDSAPLGAVLKPSATTLRTLERLDPKRFEFSLDHIRQELRRPDVTKAERDLFEWALGNVKDKTITAKHLVTLLKIKAGEWELTPAETSKYADYGLEDIDRKIDPDMVVEDYSGDPQVDNPPPTTTVWTLPFELTRPSSHFPGQPNYFAHTRSFIENGVRHVVELQSDLIQKMRELAPEEIAETVRELEAAKKARADVIAYNETLLTAEGRYRPGRSAADRQILQPFDLKIRELQGKIDGSNAAKANRPLVEPMVKDWYKRVVREELARGARSGNGQPVRFATAETTAKVESWPRAAGVRDVEGARRMVEAAEANVAEIKRSGQGLVFDTSALEGRALKAAEKELAGFKEDLAAYEEQLASGRRFASKGHQAIFDRYRGDVEPFLKSLGGKPHTDSAGHTWIEVPTEGSPAKPAGKRAQMFGAADSQFLTATALITGGAAFAAWASSREERAKNAALAAAAIGLTMFARGRSKAVREWTDEVGHQAKYVLSVISTDIREMSPRLLKRMRDHERWVLTNTNERLNLITPFVQELRKLPETIGARLNSALLTGDRAAVESVIIASGSRTLQREFERVRGLLDQMGRELHAVGRLRQLVIDSTDYYPRIVVDVKGLLEALGGEQKSVLEKLLREAQHTSARRAGIPLTDLETSLIINNYLRTHRAGKGKSGFLQARSVAEVTADLARFYAPASESLPIYIRAMTKEIEKARFFGNELVRDSQTGMTNLELSVGNVVNAERMRGRLSEEQIAKLEGLLHSRFGPGERSPSGSIQAIRNLSNVGLLGSFTSSVVQLGDTALAAAAHGLVPAAKAAFQVLTRQPQRASVRDIGLIDHITEEITGSARTPVIVMGRELSTAKFVEKTFKFNGFSMVDQFGKAVSINASLLKNQKLASTARGVERLRAKYGETWGGEFDSLVADLQRGEMSENVKSLLFYELSDLQPITKLEVPQAYLDHPNGRLLYLMRTYMIKQMDIARREIYQEARRGNVMAATKNLVRYGLALGLAGATTSFITNWILGKDNKLEWGDIPENALKTIGVSNYLRDKMRAGEPLAFLQSASPPFKMWNQIISADPAAVQYMPPLGKIYYYQEMGGAEKSDAYAKGQERLNRMSDADYERLLRRREERKERKGF